MGFGFGLDLRARTQGAAAPTIASLYGTGVGQVPLHLDPATAVMNGADVSSIPNSGGAGAVFNGTVLPEAGKTISVQSALFSIPAFYTSGAFGLALQNPADLVGTRIFFVGNADPALPHAPRIAGSPSTGHNTHIRVAFNSVFTLNRGAENVTVGAASGYNFGKLHLYEIEIASGFARVWVNGQRQGADVSCTWPDFRVDRIFVGQSHGFQGTAGDILSLIVNGNQSSQIATIRNALAAKYGLTLA